MILAFETGSAKWIATDSPSGFVSSKDQASKFEDINSAAITLQNDKRYRSLIKLNTIRYHEEG